MKLIDNEKIYNRIIDCILIEFNSCRADFHNKMRNTIPGYTTALFTRFISFPGDFEFTPGILDFSFDDILDLNDSSVRSTLVALDFALSRNVYDLWIKAKVTEAIDANTIKQSNI